MPYPTRPPLQTSSKSSNSVLRMIAPLIDCNRDSFTVTTLHVDLDDKIILVLESIKFNVGLHVHVPYLSL